jgi:hypothetical protein
LAYDYLYRTAQRWRAALGFAAISSPRCRFNGHPWNWLPNVYISGAGYYHERPGLTPSTIGAGHGLRVNDGETVLAFRILRSC